MPPESKPAFEKVGECLYRYVPMGKYYARFESNGREVCRSLGTTDRALAKRKLLDLQRATARTTGQGDKLTLAELCDRYMATMRSQAAKTIYRKQAISARIKADWPGGAAVAISKVQQSQISAWLASYDFGVPSYNLHLLFTTFPQKTSRGFMVPLYPQLRPLTASVKRSLFRVAEKCH